MIVVPVKLFNKPSSGDEDFCRFVLNGGSLSGLTKAEAHDIKEFCQCALTAVVFDGASM